MKRKLSTVLKTMSMSALARHIGSQHARISQINSSGVDAMVEFKDGKPINVQYEMRRQIIVGKRPKGGAK